MNDESRHHQKTWGNKIISHIDSRTSHARSIGLSGIFAGTVDRIKLFFVLAGGLASLIALGINSEHWPQPIRIVPQNPIVILDYSALLNIYRGIGDSPVLERMKQFGLPVELKGNTTTHLMGYPLERYLSPRTESLRPLKTSTATFDANSYMLSMNLKQVKDWYGYKDNDTNRNDLGRFSSSNDPSFWLEDWRGNFSRAIMIFQRIPGSPENFTMSNSEKDYFYLFAETLDIQEKVRFYNLLHSHSTFLSGFVVENEGRHSASNIRLAARLDQQAIATDVLTSGQFIKDDLLGNIQRMHLANILPRQKRLFVTYSKWQPMTETDFYFEERPLINQVADYLGVILTIPALFCVFSLLVKM